jgi:hypothetical protein
VVVVVLLLLLFGRFDGLDTVAGAS